LEKKYGIKAHCCEIKDIIFFYGDKELTYYRKREFENLKSFVRCHKKIKDG